jgi:hypothetical protein
MNNTKQIASSRRPRFQFTILGLMVLMLAAGIAAAPGYYLMHGGNLPQARLVGMLMLYAGPLVLMTVLSVLVSLMGRGR